jgi:hypothetical protein
VSDRRTIAAGTYFRERLEMREEKIELHLRRGDHCQDRARGNQSGYGIHVQILRKEIGELRLSIEIVDFLPTNEHQCVCDEPFQGRVDIGCSNGQQHGGDRRHDVASWDNLKKWQYQSLPDLGSPNRSVHPS